MKTKIIPFTKMSGAGNDFIIIEAQRRLNYKKLAKAACERTNGIGADGLLVLAHARRADCRMRIINADGTEAEMCGNGARCLAAYVFKQKHPGKKKLKIKTKAGIIHSEQKGEKIKIQLSKPLDYTEKIPVTINRRRIHVSYIDTGVPHVIIFVDQLKKINVHTIGNKIRWHKKFSPRGTNVNFVEQINKDTIAVRTYERGVEAETKACGTGSVASAIVTFLRANPQTIYQKDAHMNVITQSGETLEVLFDLNRGNIPRVWLQGSANLIAEGQYYYEF